MDFRVSWCVVAGGGQVKRWEGERSASECSRVLVYYWRRRVSGNGGRWTERRRNFSPGVLLFEEVGKLKGSTCMHFAPCCCLIRHRAPEIHDPQTKTGRFDTAPRKYIRKDVQLPIVRTGGSYVRLCIPCPPLFCVKGGLYKFFPLCKIWDYHCVLGL